ncbi:MAG TPA: tetratricopeptide repeat protein, partial [Candidatus Saccharimonadales bacterium]|nr:tetratricopeptide repeat protein [Candidatus Saccharimonadales bacterium]
SAGLLALAVHSVVDFNLHVPANALLGVSLLALLTAQLPTATGYYRFKARAPASIVAAVVLAGGIFYFGLQDYRRGMEAVWLGCADNADLTLLDQADILKKAFDVEPRNFQTAYDIGERYRLQSLEGGDDYESQAQSAMEWYGRGIKLDPFDAYDYLRYGMCLDWLGRHDEAGPYYSRAEALDPNGYFTVANIGWHYVQTGDYAAAQAWLQRSLRLEWTENTIAHSYWDIVGSKLTENASGQPVLPPGF